MNANTFTITTAPGSGQAKTVTHPIASTNAPAVNADKVDALWLLLRAVLSITSGASIIVVAGPQVAGVPSIVVTTEAGSATITSADAVAQNTMARLLADL